MQVAGIVNGLTQIDNMDYPEILHHGATGGVTGSCHQLLMDAQHSLLIDCGLFQGAETSADGKVWTFHLRRALWSDGVPVTAEDFVYALRRIMDPKTGSSYSSLLYIIQNGQAVNENKMPLTALGVRAIDPLTLEIRLNHAAPFLPEIAKHNSMYPVPKHVVEKWGDDWSRPEHFVGNGPFNLVSWKLGDRVTVVKNPKFYEADTVCLDQINYYPTTDASSAQKRVPVCLPPCSVALRPPWVA